jgi:hypothetical protein
VLGVAEGQRHHGGQQGDRKNKDAGNVEWPADLCPGGGQGEAGGDQGRDPSRNLDQKHQPPGQAEQVRGDDQAAK